MPKNKESQGEKPDESITAPLSYEHYRGMNDTLLTGSDALRFALAEQYQIVNALLSSDTPHLHALEAKKILNETGEWIDRLDLEKDPDIREAIYRKISDRLAHMLLHVKFHEKISTDDHTKRTMGVMPLADPKRATVIIPEDWENPDRPLH